MVPTSKLFHIVETERIFLHYADLRNCYLGVYFWDPDLGKACITLERKLKGQERLLRCVLAHELAIILRPLGNTLLQQVLPASFAQQRGNA